MESRRIKGTAIFIFWALIVLILGLYQTTTGKTATATLQLSDTPAINRIGILNDTWMPPSLLTNYTKFEGFYNNIRDYLDEHGIFPFHMADNSSLFRHMTGVDQRGGARAGPLYQLPGMKNPCWRSAHGLRCLPYFLQIGFTKCGSTTLFVKTSGHPQIIPPKAKEPTFWSSAKFTSIERYSRVFFGVMNKNMGDALKSHDNLTLQSLITGEGTPGTIWQSVWRDEAKHEISAEPKYTTALTVSAILPKVKLIVIMRNPVDRVLSHYQHMTSKDVQSQEHFHQRTAGAIKFIKYQMKRFGIRQTLYHGQHYAFLRPGLYYVYLRDWLAVINRNRFKLIRADDYYDDSGPVLQDVAAFLGLDPFPEKFLPLIQLKGSGNHRAIELKQAIESGSKPEQEPKSGTQQRTQDVRLKGRTKRDKTFHGMLEKTRALLTDFYKPFNILLADLLDDTDYLKWNEPNV